MLNYKFDSESPMALVLAGQAELWDKLRQQRYVLFRTLCAAKTGRSRQIHCFPFLMEKDEEHVKIHEVFS